MNDVTVIIESNDTKTNENLDTLLSKKERQKIYSKTFYNNHPEKLKETFFCVYCNKNISKFYKSKHDKTKIHIHNLESSKSSESVCLESKSSLVSEESSNNVSKSSSDNKSSEFYISYYCSYCDKNIAKINKNRHEKTINHMKCVSNFDSKDESLSNVSVSNDKCKKYVKYVNKNGDEVVKVYNQKKYNVKYLKKNPDKLKEKYKCEVCDKMINKYHKSQHERTRVHILYSKMKCSS